MDELVGGCLDPILADMPQSLDKHSISVILVTLFYYAWNFRNGKIFCSSKRMEEVVFDLDKLVKDLIKSEGLERVERVPSLEDTGTPPRLDNHEDQH